MKLVLLKKCSSHPSTKVSKHFDFQSNYYNCFYKSYFWYSWFGKEYYVFWLLKSEMLLLQKFIKKSNIYQKL